MTARLGDAGPVVVAAAGSAAVLVATAANGHAAWPLVPVAIVAFFAGRAHVWPAGALAALLLLGGVSAAQSIAFDSGSIVPEIMLPTTLYVAGLALRSRETVARALSDRGDELEAERDAYARLSVRYERARIAAELHDIVAHAISVMVVQATAGQRLAPNEPHRTADTFEVIAAAGRQAQSDLDRLAKLLDQNTAPEAGADLTLLEEIVDTARAAGLVVTLRVVGDTSGVSEDASHVALRVVQEGLTNALRYAPGAVVHVAVEARPSTLELSIVNGKSTMASHLGLGTGRGLTGLRERVGIRGGTLSAGPDGDGGWRVHAHIAR